MSPLECAFAKVVGEREADLTDADRPQAIAHVDELARLAPQLRTALHVLPAATPTLPISVAAIAGTVAWRALPRPQARMEAALPVSEYARCFELPEHAIEAGRNASVCVVHHDADGRIASVECR